MESLLISLCGLRVLLRKSRSVRARFGVIMSILCAAAGVRTAAAVTVNLSPMVAKSTLVSTLDVGKEINVILSLPLSDSAGAAQFAQRVSNPKDEFYRKYITPQEFAAR